MIVARDIYRAHPRRWTDEQEEDWLSWYAFIELHGELEAEAIESASKGG